MSVWVSEGKGEQKNLGMAEKTYFEGSQNSSYQERSASNTSILYVMLSDA